MEEHTDSQRAQEPDFSWERWVWQGLQAFRRALFRYDFGLPEEFWRHLETAAHELLAAGRILLRVLLLRRKTPPEPEDRGAIEIEWDE